MQAAELPVTERTRLRRKSDRGRHDTSTIEAILDEALVCHVGFAAEDGRPFVFPTAYARIDDRLYVHGAAANFALRSLGGGIPVCVTVTLLDGLVLAKSAFHHSMNYRSVMLFGTAEVVRDDAEKRAALEAIVEHMVAGRAAECRAPSANELRATLVVRLPIVEGSAKVRTGGPVEDEADIALPYWTGVVPVALVAGEPVEAGGTIS